jgi:hypothetical protein
VDDFLGTAARDTHINGFWAQAGHAGTHTDEYFLELGKKFESVTSKAEAEKALESMWKKIEKGDFL